MKYTKITKTSNGNDLYICVNVNGPSDTFTKFVSKSPDGSGYEYTLESPFGYQILTTGEKIFFGGMNCAFYPAEEDKKIALEFTESCIQNEYSNEERFIQYLSGRRSDNIRSGKRSIEYYAKRFHLIVDTRNVKLVIN